ncbi:MAG TPA: hypothetical protein VK934_07515 [Fimbriimonas sp.]|nr:hypothetical protein [Fimbriimonas sp.]
MKNVTISLDEATLDASKRYAAARGLSLNAYIKDLMQRDLAVHTGEWPQDFFELADRLGGKLGGDKPLSREEIYDR